MSASRTLDSYPLLARARQFMLAGRDEQAAGAVMEHLRRFRDHPEALALLGTLAARLGALQQAEQFFRRALARGLRDPAVRRELLTVLNQQQRLGEALILAEELEHETAITDVSLLAGRASILDKLGRYDEALALQQQLVACEGEKPELLVPLGHLFRAIGRTADAIAAYRRATIADFEFGEAWWSLASIRRKVLTDLDIRQIARGLAVAIDQRNAVPLHFAMAKALHDRGDHAAAFTHYAEGNGLRAASLAYDPAQLTQEVSEAEQLLKPAFFARTREGTPPPDMPTPIFIVSLPRSGSTLLEQMLGCHPEIEAIGELPYAPAIMRTAMELATRAGHTSVPRMTLTLSDDVARAMGQDYLRRVALHRRTDRAFFVDKLPHNWSNLPFLHRILPGAKFIDIRREAMDCCFSNFTQLFSSAHASSFSLDAIARSYRDYVRLMAHLDTVAPGLVAHVNYSQLVADPAPQLRRLLDHVGVEWSDAVLRFDQLERAVRTPSSEQVRRPLNRDGMAVWRPYESWLQPLRTALGSLVN